MTEIKKERKKPVRFSMRKLINEHCKNCCYDPLAQHGAWRQQTEACAVTKCALWPVRPVSSADKEAEE